jgi:hypothetical protein
MDLEKGFLGGFLVLGMVLFVVGFLTGMLAIAIIPMKADSVMVEFMLFILGLVTGMVTIALALVVVKLSRLQKPS